MVYVTVMMLRFFEVP